MQKKRATKINITITAANDTKLRLQVNLKLRVDDNKLKHSEEIFAFIGRN